MIPIVAQLRRALESISDVFYDLEPEVAARGADHAVQEFWHASGTAEDATVAGRGVQDTPEESDGENRMAGEESLERLFEIGAEIDRPRLESAFGGADGDAILQSVLHERGTDALGWYVPFHARGVQWGAYVSLAGLVTLALNTFEPLGKGLDVSLRLAFRAIHQHELFHFGVEYFTAEWELLHGKPCFKPASVLHRTPEGYFLEEEQCANAYMLRRFARGGRDHFLRGKTALLRQFVRNQPPGYSAGDATTSDDHFLLLANWLLHRYAYEAKGSYVLERHEPFDFLSLLPGQPIIDWRFCPVHLVHDGARFGIPDDLLRFIRCINAIEETPKFRKQLDSMDQRVALGWAKARQRLQVSTQGAGLDFKPWPDASRRLFSIRVSRSHRVHLEHDRPSGVWQAVAVGGHREMGHG